VLSSLGGRISLVVDGGPTQLGLESTILMIDGGAPRLLRPGPITLEELRQVDPATTAAAATGHFEAPGQLASHYAPAKPLRLDATSALPDEWLIGFGTVRGHDSLSQSGDLREAAARLFAALHQADRQPQARIAVAPVPEHGLGAAINDRLRRAAAPR
jgi:L-threonylcarbamoyladenylate synthase